MDPTDICKVPYNLDRLLQYVACVCTAIYTTSPVQNTIRLPSLLLLTLVLGAVLLLCGASPYQNQWHSAAACLYTAALVWLELPLFLDDTQQSATVFDPKKHVQILTRGGTTATDVCTSAAAHCVVACLIGLQILLLYDAGAQVQRWPVPIVIASTYGACIGRVLGAVAAVVVMRSSGTRGDRKD